MKKSMIIPVVLMAGLLAACSGGQKKVTVMASGELTADGNTIKVDPSLTHNEKELVFTGDKVTLTVQSTNGASKTFDLTENGSYLLNLQMDTLIGGIVNYGTGDGMPGSITSDQLDHIIDSTKQLMAGQNASDEKKSYFLPPFTIKMLTTQDNAKIIGSFKGIPYSNEPDASGKIPEVYKFFTNKQKRETLNDLMAQREKLKAV